MIFNVSSFDILSIYYINLSFICEVMLPENEKCWLHNVILRKKIIWTDMYFNWSSLYSDELKIFLLIYWKLRRTKYRRKAFKVVITINLEKKKKKFL